MVPDSFRKAPAAFTAPCSVRSHVAFFALQAGVVASARARFSGAVVIERMAMGYTVVEDPRGFVHVVFLGCVAEVDRSLAMDDATAALVSKGRSRLLVDFSKATLRNASAVQSGSPPPASGTHCKVAVVSPLELEGGQVDKANACSFRDVDTAIDWLVKDG